MQVCPGGHDPRQTGNTPPHARSVVVVVELLVGTGTHTHGSSRLAAVQASPGGHEPRHAGKRPPHASSVELLDEVVVGVAVVVVSGALEVVVELVELVVVRVAQGSGVQAPGPTSVPPSSAHCAALSGTQMNAPPNELGMQHCVGGAVLEVVLGVVAVVVVLVVPAAMVVDEVEPGATVVVDVLLVPARVVVVAVVVVGPAQGMDPFGEIRPAMQSTNAPIVDDADARSPVVRQSRRLSARAKAPASLFAHLFRQRTTMGSLLVLPAFAALAAQMSWQKAARPESRTLPAVQRLPKPAPTPSSVCMLASCASIRSSTTS